MMPSRSPETAATTFFDKLLPRPKSARWMTLAACIAAFGIVVGITFTLTNVSPTTVETHIAEWKNTLLEDGSAVHVGPRTSLRVAMDEQQRVVRLERGEAVFDIARDPARPFIVETDIVNVRAIGTRFSVTMVDGPVITVEEGSVAVSHSASRNGVIIELLAGQQLAIKDGQASVLAHVDASRALALAAGWLELKGETVAHAVAEFNRRNRMQIEIDDETLATYRIKWGTFQLSQPESFAAALEQSGQVVIVRERPNVLRLKAGPSLRSHALLH